MRVNGPKKLMRRAVFAACLLDVYDFDLDIEWSDHSCLHAHEDRPNYFRMEIDRNTAKCLLIDHITHEMVHLRQYLTGKMVDFEDFIVWNGESYQYSDPGSDEYYLSPWEMEARAYEHWAAARWENRKRELQ